MLCKSIKIFLSFIGVTISRMGPAATVDVVNLDFILASYFVHAHGILNIYAHYPSIYGFLDCAGVFSFKLISQHRGLTITWRFVHIFPRS